jgi:GTP-binding protein EngB required for normal cell division
MTGDTGAGRLRALALAAGAGELAAEAAALEERIREQRFYVACVGQFKRGKSTLLNALVGRPLLPTGVVPVTSVPTIVRYGQLGARVRTEEGWASVAPEVVGDFVTEQRNAGNVKGVLAVEVLVPAEILEGGLCLVDTPGLGSVIETNSEATREFVPHIDAALVVLGADPPISGEELRLVELIAAEADTLVFVLNKVDRVTAPEREEASSFLLAVLHDRLGMGVDRVYHVVAAGEGAGPDWDALRERLRSLAGSRRDALVRSALRRGVTRIGSALSARLQEQLAALTRPLEEYERRATELSRLGRSSEQAILELAPLLAAEEQRLERELRSRADGFLAEAQPAGLARLDAAWTESRLEQASHEVALEEANRIARALAYPWLRRAEQQAEADYDCVVRRFRRLADEHLARLAEATGLGPDAIPQVLSGAEGFRVGRHFAFSDRASYHYPRSPLPGLLERLLPMASHRRRRRLAMERYLLDLLAVNASRVVGDLAERVRESRREVEAEIRETLRRVGEVATGALEWARVVRARGVEEVGRKTARVEALLAEVERVLEPMRDRAA